MERWFAELTNKQLRRGAYQSVPQLEAAIQEFIDAHQENPKPWLWRARMSIAPRPLRSLRPLRTEGILLVKMYVTVQGVGPFWSSEATV